VRHIKDFVDQIEEKYEVYKEKSLKHRRFKHKDILPLIQNLKSHANFKLSELGKSTEGREIYLIKLGNGKMPVLLWSQMHGNEPTATQALFDIFNFFATSDNLDDVREKLLKELTLYFIPMVNPDGTEVNKRRNSLDIDPNRDAERLQCKETQLLKKIRDDINAEYGFNLHDQAIYYSAGATEKPATISFLTPSFNYEQEIDQKRVASMELIVLMNSILQEKIPGQVGRYSDDFMPTAFGDNMQLWGTSTILIESGGYKNDPEKQYVRELNFLCILTGLYGIAYKYPSNFELMDYFKIPENKKEKLFDLLIRNASVEKNGQIFKTDIGIRREEIDNDDFTGFKYKSRIEDIGDLTYYYGYEEIDANGLKVMISNKDLIPLIGNIADFSLVNSTGETEYLIKNGFVE